MRRNATRLPLRVSIPLLLLLFALAGGVFSYLQQAAQASRNVEQQAVTELSQLMTRLQGTLEFLLRRKELDQTRAEIGALGADAHLEAALLLDEHGLVLAALRRDHIGREALPLLAELNSSEAMATATEEALRTMTGLVQVMPEHDRIIGVYPVVLGAAPDELRPSRIGTLLIQRDLRHTKQLWHAAAYRQSLQFAVFMAVLATLLWLLFHSIAGRRVGTLVATAQEFAQGNLQARANLAGGDEFARIGRAFDHMAGQVASAQQRLGESEERIRLLLDSTAEGIVAVDLQGRCTLCNPAAARLLGYRDAQELLGLPLHQAVRRRDCADGLSSEAQSLAYGVLHTGAPQHAAGDVLQRADGSWFHAEYWAYPVLRENTLIGAVVTFVDVTERAQAEQDLRTSQQRLSEAQRIANIGHWDWDIGGNHLCWSDQIYRIFDLEPQAFAATYDAFLQRVHPDDRAMLDAAVRATLERDVPYSIDHRIVLQDGTVRYVHEQAELFRDEDGLPLRMLGTAHDITERKRHEEALFREKERAQVTLHSIGDAVITTDNAGHVEYLNPIAVEMTGWTNEGARGRPLAEVFNIINEITRQPAVNPVEKCLAEGRIVGLANHTVLISRDGREMAIEDSAAPIRERSGEIIGVVMVFHDVSKTRAMAQQLTWQATHDSLTGLVNRHEFELRLNTALSDALRHGHAHVLLYLDLDQFKVVNDTCGHVAGDELLKQLTTLLQSQVRETDTLARLGGDEFGVLLERCSLEAGLDVAEKLRKTAKGFRFVWEDKTFEVGASIGLVTVSEDHADVASLLSSADMACYAAKDLGRNRIHVFQKDDMEVARRQGQMQLVSGITKALEDDRFVLYHQMIVPVSAEAARPHHCEILLRMVDEDGTLVPPGSFIPAAERYDLMPAVDRWVVKTLFKLLAERAEHESEALGRCLYSVNVSGASLNDEPFRDFIKHQLTTHAIPPGTICFEITETAAIANLPHAVAFIKELKALGCCFALDDFGSGVSSFAYLKNLPVDYLKIDGGFVRDMTNDPIDHAMVDAINHIGHVMGISTIAEFVENDAIVDSLRVIGVDHAQGYGIHTPEPLELALTRRSGVQPQ